MTISKNKTKYPDLTSLKNKINNLDKSAKKINYNFIAKINSRNKNFNTNKKKVNISLIKQILISSLLIKIEFNIL